MPVIYDRVRNLVRSAKGKGHYVLTFEVMRFVAIRIRALEASEHNSSDFNLLRSNFGLGVECAPSPTGWAIDNSFVHKYQYKAQEGWAACVTAIFPEGYLIPAFAISACR